MHIGEGFVFHLDAPREQPQQGTEVQVAGWLAADAPITRLRVAGEGALPLTASPRPDVQAIFPGYAHVTGFLGATSCAQLRTGALNFEFTIGGRDFHLAQVIPAPPAPIKGWRRMVARWALAVARRRLARASTPTHRWNVGLRALCAEIQLARGEAFGRVEGDRLLELFAKTFPDAFVVQIGANDGRTGDPLAAWFPRTRWRALLVEPIGHLVAALKEVHASRPGITIDRVAVGDRNGHARIYRLQHEPGRSPLWHQLLATFDREVLLRHRALIPELESLIVEEQVETVTVPELLARHEVRRIDLLVIDTEGYDYRILRQFDLNELRPSLVIFEHQHLSAEERAAALALLREQSYLWQETPEGDTFAWRRL